MKFRLILMAVSAFLAVVPLSADEGKTIKRKVAIGRFSNETQYGKGLFYDKENDPMRKQAMDIHPFRQTGRKREIHPAREG